MTLTIDARLLLAGTALTPGYLGDFRGDAEIAAAEAALRTCAAEIAIAYDATAADDRATPREKDERLRGAAKGARRTVTVVADQVARLRAALARGVAELDARLADYDRAAPTILETRRLDQLAQVALDRHGGDLGAAITTAARRGDRRTLHALGVHGGGSPEAARALLELDVPDAVRRVDWLRVAVPGLEAAVRRTGRALDEIAAAAEPAAAVPADGTHALGVYHEPPDAAQVVAVQWASPAWVPESAGAPA